MREVKISNNSLEDSLMGKLLICPVITNCNDCAYCNIGCAWFRICEADIQDKNGVYRDNCYCGDKLIGTLKEIDE